MSNVNHISQDNFDAQVLKADKPVLVDFYADWCGPCRALAPTLENLASEFDGKVDIVKINVDEAGELAGSFGIRSIPTLLLFKDGDVVQSQVGGASQAQLTALMNNVS